MAPDDTLLMHDGEYSVSLYDFMLLLFVCQCVQCDTMWSWMFTVVTDRRWFITLVLLKDLFVFLRANKVLTDHEHYKYD